MTPDGIHATLGTHTGPIPYQVYLPDWNPPDTPTSLPIPRVVDGPTD